MTINNLNIGILSYKAHKTLRASLETHVKTGLTSLPRKFFIYYNDLNESDTALAREFNLPHFGGQNSGIYGGFRAIAELSDTEYVLILENDILTLSDQGLHEGIQSCLEDMKTRNINVFCLRSRHLPGQGMSDRKYRQAFGIHHPINKNYKSYKTNILAQLSMRAKHGYLSKFKSRAIMFEKDPEIAQPEAIQKLPSGNYITDSRYCNWTNQSLLVNREFFLNVICQRVEKHPDPRLVNGFQDIERALNSIWWRRRKEPIGFSATGFFTHGRIDR